MGMLRFAANYILPISQPPIKNGIVETDDDGRIIRIIDPQTIKGELNRTQFFNGVIVPGFVNSHCHIELSHLKGAFRKKTGITGFIDAIIRYRAHDNDVITKAISDAITLMRSEGTVAVGDICNTTDTLQPKKKGQLLYRNFIELFGINPEIATSSFSNTKQVLEQFTHAEIPYTSITPHATYSLSKTLWNLLRPMLQSGIGPVSIHYGESKAEYDFLKSDSGSLKERYTKANIPYIPSINQSPEIVVKNHIPNNRELILVHCTFSAPDELKSLERHFKKLTVVTCPESNLFIENSLANLPAFAAAGLTIAIGTDSLASSDSLSMLNQINLILNRYPSLPFTEVLRWATLNGAEALGFSNTIGSIEPGKSPGLNLITNFDFSNFKPTANSKVIPLLPCG